MIRYFGIVLEIHSSSQYIPPAGNQAHATGDKVQLKQTDQTTHETARPPVSANEEFETAAQKKQKQQLPALLSLPEQRQTLNRHTAQALNTYTNTFNQVAQQTSAGLTGIDLYA